jgi:SAM-dependent methyltransferase
MKPITITFARWLLVFGDPRKLLRWIYLPKFFAHWRKYQAIGGGPLRFADSYPCLEDWVSSTPFDPHYFFQGAWLARKLVASEVKLHVDVGSSVLSIGMVSAYVPTVFVDYRPLNARLSDLLNVGGSIVSLPFASASIASLSCMHVLEHIGLGRYGDPLDPDGANRAGVELARVLAPGGELFLTTPVGRERVCFNAHRVFAFQSLVAMFPQLQLVSFSCVDDNGQFSDNVAMESAESYEYGCGMFHFRKP